MKLRYQVYKKANQPEIFVNLIKSKQIELGDKAKNYKINLL